MSTLSKRILSALVLAPVTLGILWLGGWFFYAFMALVFGICVQEWSRLSLRGGRVSWALLLAGVVYVLLACLVAIAIRGMPGGFFLFLGVLLAIWACDVGAYASGKMIGGPKMAPSISPNKTWAGLAGGCVASVLMIMGYHALVRNHISPEIFVKFTFGFQIMLGLMLAVIGQLGDLLVSVLKRKSGLKDTGNIIPGHGGLLDRVDALLLAIPVYGVVLYFMAM